MGWEGGLSIDELLNELRGYDPATVLSPGFNEAMSYRGYYECLGLEPCPNATVREMTEVLREAKGATYPGYKGGDYTMDGDTECFLAEYGSSGVPITREWVDLHWKARPELTEAQARIAELEHVRSEQAQRIAELEAEVARLLRDRANLQVDSHESSTTCECDDCTDARLRLAELEEKR